MGSHGPVLGPVLFSLLVNDCTGFLSQFAGSRNLGRIENMPQGTSRFPTDLDRLGSWAGANRKEFSAGHSEMLQCGRSNHPHVQTGGPWLGGSSEERGCGGLVLCALDINLRRDEDAREADAVLGTGRSMRWKTLEVRDRGCSWHGQASSGYCEQFGVFKRTCRRESGPKGGRQK